MLRRAILSLAAVAFAGTLQAAQLSVQNAQAEAGTEVAVAIGYAAQGGQAVGLQFDVRFDGSLLAVTAEAGEAALAAGKTLSTNAIDDDTLRIIISGVNQNVLGDGPVAALTFSISLAAPEGDYGILLTEVSASDEDGQEVAVTAVNGTLTVMPTTLPPLLIFPQYAEGTLADTSNQTRLIIRNNSDQADSGVVRFLDSSGNGQQVPVGGFPASVLSYHLGPWSSTEIVTDGTSANLLSGPLTVLSERGQESLLEATLIFTLLGDNFVSVDSAPQRTQHQIYVSVNASENTGLALYNPGQQAITLDLVLLDEAGSAPAEPLSAVIGAGQQMAVFVDQPPLFVDFFEPIDDFKGTLNIRVREDGEVAVLGLIQQRASGALIAVASSPRAAP